MKTGSVFLIVLAMGSLWQVGAQMPRPMTDIASTNAYVMDMESSVKQLCDEIAALKRSLEKDIAALRAQVEVLNKQIGERRGSMSPFDTLERRVEELERDLKDMESTLRRLDSRVQKLESRR